MGQVGWEYEGRVYTHQEFLELARTYPPDFPWTPEMVKGMYQGEGRSFISPSMLTSCPRKVVLERETAWTQEPEKAYAAFRGTMAHTLLEHLKHEEDAICERRVRALVDLGDGRSVWLSGKPDKLVPSQSLILDYKTLKELKKGEPKSSWTPQLSSYRWLLAQEHEYLDEETGTWYPEGPLYYERAQIAQLTMQEAGKLEIKLWPLDAALAWLRGRIKSHFIKVFDGTYNLDNLPPVLQMGLDEDSYLCFGYKNKKTGVESRPWCSVAYQCRALAKEGK